LGWKPSPTTSPASFTTTQPTIGFGRVLPITERVVDTCRMRDLVLSFVEGDRGKDTVLIQGLTQSFGHDTDLALWWRVRPLVA
jgi:hypothetical protein